MGLPLTRLDETIEQERPLSRGVVLRRRLASEPRQVYYLYLPLSIPASPRVLVSVHGISRNGREHAERCARLADRYGVILVAPLFSRRRHHRFQQLGLHGPRRSDRALIRILDEVASQTAADVSALHMFGFSGGGQFAHRFAMAYPERVRSYVIGAPGWYTLPDETRPFPRGTGLCKKLPDIEIDLGRFLQIPATVLVGDRDTERDVTLNTARWIDRALGRDRVRRAAGWIERMNNCCRERGIAPHHQVEYLAGVGHDFNQCMLYGNMGELIFRRLFGPPEAGALTHLHGPV